MYSFANDYSESAHPRLLQALIETNLEQTPGYGMDCYSQEAADMIRNLAQCPTAAVHFIPGGTQTNLIAISSFLRAGQAVLCADTGHIRGHESGAIEATGHRAVPVPNQNGKVTPEALEQALDAHQEEFTPRPAMVYVSQSTEFGTIYQKSELEALHDFCRSHRLLLFVDGARLGSALCCSKNDLSLSDLARLTDAFSIGGTKNGALFGEALVLINDELHPDFRRLLKMRGGMLAKGKVLGVQFRELFRDGLYWELANHANDMADLLRNGLISRGIPLLVDSPTNQLFPILAKELVSKLESEFTLTFWEHYDNQRDVMRICTSWATPQQACTQFLECLDRLLAI